MLGIQNGILVITDRNKHAEVDPLGEVPVSQDQPEIQEAEIQAAEPIQQESSVIEETPIDSQEEAPEGPKKRVRKKAPKLTEADVQPPKPSIWPLALALAIVVMMAGSVYNGIFLGIGGLLVLACVIGWAMERRR